ncbi:MAG: 16S rRNA (cytidine(1402)-2'-O)-methyltransferase [Acidobacteria bacterium]|nr:16S rRNA (cytidine(1402)-2'-O)-methyltransferase [Acidobacteriota bacterium]
MSESAPLAPGLYLVATPIGNLEDITLRALRVLRSCDRIACEDTRQTQKLLNHFGIETRTVSYHLHNEQSRAEELIADLRNGARIAVVSDAGTPGIADPGVEVVQAAIAAGISVYPIPGASAALSALIASGLDTEQFTFRGFLPSKSGERKSLLEIVKTEMSNGHRATQIFYETPHRIADALADIEAIFSASHRITLARELTKLHEEFLRGTVVSVRAEIEKREAVRGEMVLLLSGDLDASTQNASEKQSIADEIRSLMERDHLDEKEALKRVAKNRSLGKSEVYREWQRSKR